MNIPYYALCTVLSILTTVETRCTRTDRQTDIVTYRAAIAAKKGGGQKGQQVFFIQHIFILQAKFNCISMINKPSGLLKTRWGQTDHPTDGQTDIVTYRAAIAAKN